MFDELWRLVRGPYNSIHVATMGECATLEYLSEQESPVSPTELSRFFNVSTARITTLINQLERKCYVRRMPVPDDRRKVSPATPKNLCGIKRVPAKQSKSVTAMAVTLFPDGIERINGFVFYIRQFRQPNRHRRIRKPTGSVRQQLIRSIYRCPFYKFDCPGRWYRHRAV